MPVCKLTKRAIDALPCPADRDVIWWDEDLKGLGLKITPADRRTFLVRYRPAGDRRNPRKYTIGEYGSVTTFQARVEAREGSNSIAFGANLFSLAIQGFHTVSANSDH